MVCRKCEAKAPMEKSDTVVLSETSSDSNGILVIDESQETLPKTRALCSQCGNKEAYWVLRQMRAADEPETRLYRCTKCGNTWREN
jgi:DNA-directed RNA polymerase subunit M